MPGEYLEFDGEEINFAFCTVFSKFMLTPVFIVTKTNKVLCK